MILFIKHIAIEGPDMIEAFFKEKGLPMRTVEFQNGDQLPEDLSGLNAVISLGGPMNVYAEGKYPFLRHENKFIKRVLEKQVPFMGICLGSQLLAKACGAKVGKSPGKEIGMFPISIEAQGFGDPLLNGLPDSLDVFQWHEDMSALPSEAILLASSRLCPHQAFRVGSNAYGIQFHFEVTEPTVQKWIDTYFSKNDHKQMEQRDMIIESFRRNQEGMRKICVKICRNFLAIINQKNNASFT